MLCILNVGTVPMLCILYVGTVPTLCILNVGTVPTFSHSLKNKVFELNHQLELWRKFLSCHSKACKTIENILSCVENIPKEISSAQENGKNVLLFTLI